ncbi:MAG TPA: radical SAM protein, partial [Candidatus Hypogeohydataceae bacterium YC41]
SNSSFPLPEDRTFETLAEIIKNFEGSINIIGGEPTIREDLLQLIRVAKTNNNRIVSISTNGQRLRDINFVKGLKDNGLDYVYLSLNDIEYEESKTIYQNKLEALNNCCKFSMPVWLQRTIDELNQLDSILDVLGTYKRVIFSVTIRAVKPFGVYYPTSQIFVSDMLKYLKKEKDYTKGTEPFNCRIILKGKQARISSWVNDVKRLDPIDCSYIISNDVMTTFHRGMKIDEVLIKNQRFLNV